MCPCVRFSVFIISENERFVNNPASKSASKNKNPPNLNTKVIISLYHKENGINPDKRRRRIMSFPINFWYGIRPDFISRERLCEAKEAGFNIIECRYDAKTNKRVLEWCEELGLKAYLWDDRMKDAINEAEDWQEALSQMISEYKDYPALDRYFIKDEPNNDAVPMLARIAKFIREHDQKHGFYVNLFPDAAFPNYDAYTEHMENYITATGCDLLSFDRYCMNRLEVTPEMLASGGFVEARVSDCSRCKNDLEGKIFFEVTTPGYFNNMELVKKKADEKNIPWMIIVLVSEHLTYRHVTEAEIRFEAFSALAYGASQLSYFTYWTPGASHTEPWKYSHGIIRSDGTRDENYYIVQRINSELQSLHAGLEGASHSAVFHVGEEQDELVTHFSGYGGVSDISGGRIIAGFFENKLILMNKDFNSVTVAKVRTDKTVERYSKYAKVWYRLDKREEYNIRLSAGDAELIRLVD